MLEIDPQEVANSLTEQAEKLFGKKRAAELRPELEVMAEQLATLRATPVDIQDEP